MSYGTNGVSIYPDYVIITPTTEGDSGDNTVVAAVGAGKRMALQYLKVQNISGSEVTVLVKFGSTVIEKALVPDNEAFVIWADDECREWRSAANEALIVNLSGALDCIVSGRYRLIPA